MIVPFMVAWIPQTYFTVPGVSSVTLKTAPSTAPPVGAASSPLPVKAVLPSGWMEWAVVSRLMKVTLPPAFTVTWPGWKSIALMPTTTAVGASSPAGEALAEADGEGFVPALALADGDGDGEPPPVAEDGDGDGEGDVDAPVAGDGDPFVPVAVPGDLEGAGVLGFFVFEVLVSSTPVGVVVPGQPATATITPSRRRAA